MIEFKEEKSFLEHLHIADSERVHSEFFSWLFSSACKAISDADKYKAIDSLFNLKDTNQIKNIGTEIDNVDIFIQTNSTVLIIENKIKSSQHSNQLLRYKELVEFKYPTEQHRFIYLSLVKEQRVVENGWCHVSYYDIHKQLHSLKLLDHKHSIFVDDYRLYLTKVLSVLEDFLLHPTNYLSVFKNGSLKKSDKLHLKFENDKEHFIAKNQLETIFQKAYLAKFLETERVKCLNGSLNETRGTALIDFPLKRNISIGDKKLYTTFIQIQADNIKFAFAIQEKYLKSNRDWIIRIIDIFKSFSTRTDIAYNKLNSPKSLAYVSISKKIEIPYWKMSYDEFSLLIENEIRLGHEVTEKLMLEIN